IRVFDALRVLDCSGTWTATPNGPKSNGRLADLAPLKGMNLAALTYLKLSATKVGDAGMVYFKDCKNLTLLNLTDTRVSDAGLIPFTDCKALTHLNLGQTQVSGAGLAHFQGMPLVLLWIGNTDITDLTPLKSMPLEDIRLNPKNITRGLDNLRDMKS